MPSVNPPADRAEAISHPTFIYRDSTHGFEVRMGPEKIADTLPEATPFRYVVAMRASGETWSGYLYKEA